MKKYRMNLQSNVRWLTGVLAICLVFALGSCTEEIDESNFAIKTDQTISEYVASNPEFSGIRQIFDRVKLGSSADASSLTSVLSTRGNYTVFLPNDAAIAKYLEEVGVSDVASLSDELAEVVAQSCVIDNGEQSAYESADFPTRGSLTLPNLKSRLLDCNTDENGDFVIAKTSRVIKSDIEVSNGMIHIVETVIAPSNKALPDLIGQAGNMRIMGHLLNVTTWADSLTQELDMEYETDERPESFLLSSVNYNDFVYPDHRYFGYTALVEPDEVYAQWGITLPENSEEINWDDVMNKVRSNCEAAYGKTGNDAIDKDWTHPDNAVNKFVAYHLLNGRMAYNKFVRHYSEYDYKYGEAGNPQTKECPTNVWDYYTTMGKYRALIKITQVGDAGEDPNTSIEDYSEHAIFVNRISKYANGRHDNYRETGTIAPGLKISATNGEYDNNAANGYYYPIDGFLLNNEETKNHLSSERIRFDVTTVMHEYITNNIRGGEYTICPKGYFENICNESSDTKVLYLFEGLSGAGGQWNDYQGDEVMVSGLYDFTMKLPPVPKDGTYELRMGVAMNSLRGMCQIYFGDSPTRLQPAGLPYDMRQSPGPTNPAIPWIEDSDIDDEINAENDKNLRNQGYLKGPQYYTIGNGKADTPVRQRGGGAAAIRRIINIYDLKADKTYYLRFKSALKKLDSQFFMDYFEFVPSNIYNGATPEDIW